MNPFDQRHTRRVAAELRFRRADANDARLGERVGFDEAGYAAADIAIITCPQDEGVRRNGGRLGAAQAPGEIRRWLYRLSVNRVESLQIVDVGDTLIQPTLEATHDLHEALVRQLLDDGKRVIVLGGGNDISYPDCAALARHAGRDVAAVNVDAHFDVRADTPRNSGTPYRMLLEDGHVRAENFFEIGWQPFANSPTYERYLRDKGAHIVGLDELRARGLAQIFPAEFLSSDFVFWGFDLDVVRAADAPGVSAPNPLGMVADEFVRIADLAGRTPGTRVVEFSEVNPNFDVDGRTARLAALAVWRVLAGMATGA